MTVNIQTTKDTLINQLHAIKDELNSNYHMRYKVVNLDEKTVKPELNIKALTDWMDANYPTARKKSRKPQDWCIRAAMMLVLYERKDSYHNLRLTGISKIFNRNHSTLLYGVEKAKDILSCEHGRGDIDTKNKIKSIVKQLSDLMDSGVFNV